MGAASTAQRACNREPSQPTTTAVIGRRQSALRIAPPALCILLLLLSQDLAAATSLTTIAFAVNIENPPLAFKQSGVVKGLEVDLARALAAALDLELSLHALPEPRLMDALRGGRVDVALSALPSDELAALGLATSESVLDSGQMAIVRTDELGHFPRLIDLKLTNARVGYQRGSLGARLVQAQLPRAERVPFANANEGLAALRDGEIAVFIHEATTAWSLAANPEETALTAVFQPISIEQLRFITRTEDAQLRRDLDRVLDAWRRSGELERIIRRWIPIQIRVRDRFSQHQEPDSPWSGRAAPRPACHRDTT
ncbi:transporter substrate-binding domain-containing protein [Lamprobacter modestohalophilus]|uniref:substrate-binding periplasmic protein n=1 Tax=Lamprobacter modestohalophilus TaxID=1064514 RepID=UPI002ADEDDC9|nr:transporter substrate-binding domain-containing protein [Lamprobacter modestohalophilus]MEA1050356.1 transporter substrate-binding domain-containing protein [Lamprobacter modestohalophilus]